MSNQEFKNDRQKIDCLTGLPNFSSLLDYFDREIETKDCFGTILLDIDRFTVFNHSYGYLEGDLKLKQIADLIRQTVPPNTSIFRSGGDEFAIFSKKSNMAEVVSIAIDVKDIINQQFSRLPLLQNSYYFPDRSQLSIVSPLAVSCGITFYPMHGKSFADLRETAYNAMFHGGKCINRGGILVVADFEKRKV